MKWENWRELRKREHTNSPGINWEKVGPLHKSSLHKYRSCRKEWSLQTIPEIFKMQNRLAVENNHTFPVNRQSFQVFVGQIFLGIDSSFLFRNAVSLGLVLRSAVLLARPAYRAIPQLATWYMELAWYIGKRFWQSTCMQQSIHHRHLIKEFFTLGIKVLQVGTPCGEALGNLVAKSEEH